MTFLYEDYPLKHTSDIGDFSKEAVIPVVYGDMTSSLIPLARLSNTEFVVDGKVVSISSVWVDDAEITGYKVSTHFYTNGEPYTKVTTSRVLSSNEVLSASIIGKLSPSTGRVLDNPADIMADILLAAGISSSFDMLRAECAANGIVLAGAITNVQSIQSIVDIVAQSCGAIWTPTTARLYPSDPLNSPKYFDDFNISGLVIDTPSSGYADTLKVLYDHNYKDNQPSRSMLLSCTPSKYATMATLYLPMVRSAFLAEKIGKSALRRLASDKMLLNFTASDSKVSCLDWVNISHPDIPLNSGNHSMMILGSDKSLDSPSNELTGEIVFPTPLNVRVVSTSLDIRLTSNATLGYTYDKITKVLKVTVTKGSSTPAPDVLLAVDSVITATTDAKGQAYFTVEQGKHTLYAYKTGLLSQKLEIIL